MSQKNQEQLDRIEQKLNKIIGLLEPEEESTFQQLDPADLSIGDVSEIVKGWTEVSGLPEK